MDELNNHHLLLSPSVEITSSVAGYNKVGVLEDIYIQEKNNVKKTTVGIYTKNGVVALALEGDTSLNKLLKNSEFKAIYDDFVNGKIARKFANELTLEEEAVLKFYTNKSYYKFNQALIKGNKTDDIIEIENLLNNTLDKIPSSSGTYYRGIGKEEIEMLEKLKVGDEITYKNFLSTTSDRDIAVEFLTKNNLKTKEVYSAK